MPACRRVRVTTIRRPNRGRDSNQLIFSRSPTTGPITADLLAILGDPYRAGDVVGGQLSMAFNPASSITGAQISLVNVSEDLTGVQIGLVNVNVNGWLPFFPGINIGF